MRPAVHVISSACAGGAVYAATASPQAAGACVLTGVFIDLDHLVDFFALSGERFTVRGFFSFCNEARGQRFYLPFHSVELLALWALWASGNAHPAALGALVGGGLHLLLDQVGNRGIVRGSRFSPAFYFLGYRALQGFRKDRLIRKLVLPLLLGLSTPGWSQGSTRLSVFEPRGGSCRWLRVDPGSKKTSLVASFRTECAGASAAWSHDMRKAMVFFDPADPSRKSGAVLAEIRLDGSKARTFSPPEKGAIKDFGYGGAGRPVVLTLEEVPKVDVSQGIPAQSYAFELSRKGEWEQIESKATSVDWEGAQGVAVLDSSKDLGPRTRLMSDPRPAADAAAYEDDKRLRAVVPAEGAWMRLRSASAPVYFVEAEGGGAAGLILFEQDGKLLAPPGLDLTEEDRVSLTCQGPFLLVAGAESGSSPRLYDLMNGKLLYSSDTATGAVFSPD